MERNGRAILHRVIRECLSDEETFEYNVECNEKAIYLDLWRRTTLGSRNNM